MCVIIQGNKKDITDQILETCFISNRDGFGLMYIDQNNNLITEKLYTKKLSKIKKVFKKHLPNIISNVALHFRFTTVGTTNNFNSHPFKVLEKSKGDLFDLSLMHNSPAISRLEIDKTKSDTFHFVEYYLKPILKANPYLIDNKTFIDDLAKIINAHCDTRVLLLENKNNLFHLLGHWQEAQSLNVSNSTLNPPVYAGRAIASAWNWDTEDNNLQWFNRMKKKEDTYFSDLKPYGYLPKNKKKKKLKYKI
jgi:predicted glutamine amidotransferase